MDGNRNKNSNKVIGIGLVLFFLSVYLFSIGFTVVREFTPANHKQIEIVAAKETLTVTSSVMFIPIGRDHYYVGIDAYNNCYLIRASAGWFRRHFDSEGIAKEGSLVISAPIRMINRDMSKPLNDQLSEIHDYFPDGYGFYYYAGYLFEDGLKLCFLLSLLATVIILSVSHILDSRKREYILEYDARNIARPVRNPKWDGTVNWKNRLGPFGFKLLLISVLLMILVMWRFK